MRITRDQRRILVFEIAVEDGPSMFRLFSSFAARGFQTCMRARRFTFADRSCITARGFTVAATSLRVLDSDGAAETAARLTQ